MPQFTANGSRWLIAATQRHIYESEEDGAELANTVQPTAWHGPELELNDSEPTQS